MATSKIKGGAQSFSCTMGEGITGSGSGIVDYNTGIVTIIFRAGKDSNILLDDALCNVPAEYRPTASKTGAGIVVNAADSVSASMVRVLPNGDIQQRASNTCRRVFGVIQYIL